MGKLLQIVKAPNGPAPTAAHGGRWRRWCRQLGWMVLIWALSVAALGICAGLMRLFMQAMGMR
jgi:hypothetical protein